MNEVDELLLEHFDVILDHSGVKGMKWGVRKKIINSKVFKATERHAQKTANGKRARAGQKIGKTIRDHKKGLKIAGGVAATVAVAAGSAYVSRKLSTKNMISISAADKFANEKSARILRDAGHQFVKNYTDSALLNMQADRLVRGAGDFNARMTLARGYRTIY